MKLKYYFTLGLFKMILIIYKIFEAILYFLSGKLLIMRMKECSNSTIPQIEYFIKTEINH